MGEREESGGEENGTECLYVSHHRCNRDVIIPDELRKC